MEIRPEIAQGFDHGHVEPRVKVAPAWHHRTEQQLVGWHGGPLERQKAAVHDAKLRQTAVGHGEWPGTKLLDLRFFFWQLPNGKIPKTEGVLTCFNGTIIYRWWIFHCHICFFRRVLVLCCVFFVVPLFSQSSKATLWMRSSPLILFIFCWCYCFEKTMIWCSLLLNGTGS